jgi:hypothetical protein
MLPPNPRFVFVSNYYYFFNFQGNSSNSESPIQSAILLNLIFQFLNLFFSKNFQAILWIIIILLLFLKNLLAFVNYQFEVFNS